MPFNDYGFEHIGSFIMCLNPSNIGSMCFGIDNSLFDGTKSYLGNEIQRKQINWSWDGDVPKGTITLSQAEANGSGIQELGLCSANSVGSDVDSRDLSAIGSKTSAFSVDITMSVRLARK